VDSIIDTTHFDTAPVPGSENIVTNRERRRDERGETKRYGRNRDRAAEIIHRMPFRGKSYGTFYEIIQLMTKLA